MKKKIIVFLYGELWIMCLGPLGIFSSSMKIAEARGYQNILSIHL